MSTRLDPKHQVRATFNGDPGIVEVFSVDAERTALMLGVRPDEGHGAFVRMTADEAQQVAALLYRPERPASIRTPCPACGSGSLITGSDGSLVCGYLSCKDPLMADRALRGLDEMRRALAAATERARHLTLQLAPFREPNDA